MGLEGDRQGDAEQAGGVVTQQQLPHGKMDVEEIEILAIDLLDGGIPGEAVLPQFLG